jgi:hypothetical protein
MLLLSYAPVGGGADYMPGSDGAVALLSPQNFCAPGTALNASSGACEPCAAGFTSTGGSACAPCPENTFAASGAAQCAPCAAGAFSAGGAAACGAPVELAAAAALPTLGGIYACTRCGVVTLRLTGGGGGGGGSDGGKGGGGASFTATFSYPTGFLLAVVAGEGGACCAGAGGGASAVWANSALLAVAGGGGGGGASSGSSGGNASAAGSSAPAEAGAGGGGGGGSLSAAGFAAALGSTCAGRAATAGSTFSARGGAGGDGGSCAASASPAAPGDGWAWGGWSFAGGGSGGGGGGGYTGGGGGACGCSDGARASGGGGGASFKAALVNVSATTFVGGGAPANAGASGSVRVVSILCAAGAFRNPDTGACDVCPAGSFAASGAPFCSLCPAGTFNPSSNSASISACHLCASGSFGDSAGAASCSICAAGKYNPSPGGASSAACLPCPEGTYGATAGLTTAACTGPCSAGYYCPAGSTSATQIACPSGSYCMEGARASCPPGTTSASNATELSACAPCPAGSYCPGGAASIPCPAGSFSATAAFTATCSRCPMGTFAAAAGALNCTACPSGNRSGAGAAYCAAVCPALTLPYGDAFCGLCPAGYGASNALGNGCVACPPGQTSAPGRACAACAAGTFAADPGTAPCTPCPAGRFSSAANATSNATCAPCPAGAQSLPGASTCSAQNMPGGCSNVLAVGQSGPMLPLGAVQTWCTSASGSKYENYISAAAQWAAPSGFHASFVFRQFATEAGYDFFSAAAAPPGANFCPFANGTRVYPSPPLNTVLPGGACGFNSGSMTTPGTYLSHADVGVAPYPASAACPPTTFTAAEGSTITFSLTAFGLENGYDFLYLYDGPSTLSPLIAEATGSNLNKWTTTGPALTIRWSSDLSFQEFGIAATVTFDPYPLPEDLANFGYVVDSSQLCAAESAPLSACAVVRPGASPCGAATPQDLCPCQHFFFSGSELTAVVSAPVPEVSWRTSLSGVFGGPLSDWSWSAGQSPYGGVLQVSFASDYVGTDVGAAFALSLSPCPAGAFCPDGAASPVPCAAGTYNPAPGAVGADACAACPSGFYSSNPAAAAPPPAWSCGSLQCAGNDLAGAPAASAALCAARCLSVADCGAFTFIDGACWLKRDHGLCADNGGYISPLIAPNVYCKRGASPPALGGTLCAQCAAGYFCPPRDSPLLCPLGTLSPAGSTTLANCLLCAAGSFCPPGNGSSFLCPAGTFSALPGRASAAACAACPAGRWSAPGATSCFTCPSGFYMSPAAVNGSSLCVLCPPGAFCPAAVPSPCPAGTFNPASGAAAVSACVTCPRGSFCPSGAHTPYPCAPGFFGAAAGLVTSSCSGACAAPARYGCAAGATANNATLCAEGFYCPGGTPAAALPCNTPAQCGARGLAAEPPCAWAVATPATAGVGSAAGVAADGGGAIFVADAASATVKRVQLGGAAAVFAGTPNAPGWVDGAVNVAKLSGPAGLALGGDLLFVVEAGNHVLRVVSSAGEATSLAGSGVRGFADGVGTSASFSSPLGVAYGGGMAYVADTGNARVRRVTPLGSVTTLPGLWTAPRGIAINSVGTLFVADAGGGAGGVLRAVFPTGAVAPFVGGGGGGARSEWADGVGSAASLSNSPAALLFLPNGNLLLADNGTALLRNVTARGGVSTIAGGNASLGDAPSRGAADGVGTLALFSAPAGLAALPGGAVVVADGGGRLRTLTCVVCPPSFFCPAAGAAALCPAGFFCAPGAQRPTPCPAGTWSTALGATTNATCATCPAGRFCPAGSFLPLVCPVGSFCKAGAATATPCDAGLHNPDAGKSSPAFCLPCAPGSFQDAPGASACVECTRGSFCPAAGAAAPTPCAGGTFNNATGATSDTACLACGPGTFCPPPAAVPLPCPAGTFNPASNSASDSACAPCPLGSASASLAASAPEACLACAPGTYAGAPASPRCAACPANTFSNASGAPSVGACAPCPAGFSPPGSTACALATFYPSGAPSGVVSTVLDGVAYWFARDDAAPLRPAALAAGAGGAVFVAEATSAALLRVSLEEGVVLLAGGGGPLPAADGAGAAAAFERPSALAASLSGSGVIFVADGNAIRAVSALGDVTTVLGNGTAGFSDSAGAPEVALFSAPRALAAAASDVLYLADTGNDALRVADPATGVVRTLQLAAPAAPRAPFALALDPVGGVLYALENPAAPLCFAVLLPASGAASGGALEVALLPLPGAALAAASALAVAPNAYARALAGEGELYSAAATARLYVSTREQVLQYHVDPLRDARWAPAATLLGAIGAPSAACGSVKHRDGNASSACFSGVVALALDGAESALLVADGGNSAVRAAAGFRKVCPPGAFCAPEAEAPTLCPAGTFLPRPGSAFVGDCAPCAAGTASGARGAAAARACAPCRAGAFSLGGAAACTQCPAGRFSAGGGAASEEACLVCPAGTFSAPDGASCTPCPGGFYSIVAGASSLGACSFQCLPGYFCPPGSNTSLPCPQHFFSTAVLAASNATCTPCPPGSVTLAPGSSSCTAETFSCPPGQQPRVPGVAPTSPASCAPLVCPPPLRLAAGGGGCEGCAPGSAGAPPNCTTGCPAGAICPGFTSTPLMDFGAALLGGAGRRALAAGSSGAARSPLLRACPLASLQTAPPAPPENSLLAAIVAYSSFVGVFSLLLLATLLVYLLGRWRPAVAGLVKRLDFFHSAHRFEEGEPVTHFPTLMGGLFSLWAVGAFLALGANLVQQFQTSNVLVQQSLAMYDDSLWSAGGAAAQWASARLPWAAPEHAAASGLQVRLLASGEAGACAAPLAWGAAGGGAGGWSLASTPNCGGSGVAAHVFSCPRCALSEASALTATFHFSCQSLLLEALALPSFPQEATSVRRASANATVAAREGALKAVRWTLRTTLTSLVDNATASGDMAGAQQFGYVFSGEDVATVRAPYAALKPSAAAVGVTVEFPLQPFVASTQLTLLVSFATLVVRWAPAPALFPLPPSPFSPPPPASAAHSSLATLFVFFPTLAPNPPRAGKPSGPHGRDFRVCTAVLYGGGLCEAEQKAPRIRGGVQAHRRVVRGARRPQPPRFAPQQGDGGARASPAPRSSGQRGGARNAPARAARAFCGPWRAWAPARPASRALSRVGRANAAAERGRAGGCGRAAARHPAWRGAGRGCGGSA